MCWFFCIYIVDILTNGICYLYSYFTVFTIHRNMIRFETRLTNDGEISKRVVIEPLDRKVLLRHGVINKASQAILSESRTGNVVDQVASFLDGPTGLLDALHVRKGLIVGSERELVKQKVKALVQSF